MGTCKRCSAPNPPGHQFCSHSCRAWHNGQNGWGRTNQGHTKTCENCGNVFSIPASRIATARACSRKCLGILQGKERKGRTRAELGIQTYRRARKDACERCGSDRHLVVHHKDENRYNNELSNLETLCRRCHQIHHRCELNLPQNRATNTTAG